MEFVNQTVIGEKELAALARGARKSVRRKKGMIVRIVGTAVILLNIVFCVLSIRLGDSRWWLNGVLALFLQVIIYGEDRLNGRVNARHILPEAREVTASFGQEEYTAVTASSESRFTYGQIHAVCETDAYFLFYLDRNLGQIYDKNGFTRGTAMAFREFISRKTGMPVRNVR